MQEESRRLGGVQGGVAFAVRTENAWHGMRRVTRRLYRYTVWLCSVCHPGDISRLFACDIHELLRCSLQLC